MEDFILTHMEQNVYFEFHIKQEDITMSNNFGWHKHLGLKTSNNWISSAELMSSLLELALKVNLFYS